MTPVVRRMYVLIQLVATDYPDSVDSIFRALRFIYAILQRLEQVVNKAVHCGQPPYALPLHPNRLRLQALSYGLV